MDERSADQDRGRRRSPLGRFSIAQSASRIGPVRPGQLGAVDELVVHPRHIPHMVIGRRAFRLASRAFLVATPWCREQRLLAPNHALRWEANMALLTSLGVGLALGARLTAFLLKVERKSTVREDRSKPR
jgi:hypothetical protein